MFLDIGRKRNYTGKKLAMTQFLPISTNMLLFTVYSPFAVGAMVRIYTCTS